MSACAAGYSTLSCSAQCVSEKRCCFADCLPVEAIWRQKGSTRLVPGGPAASRAGFVLHSSKNLARRLPHNVIFLIRTDVLLNLQSHRGLRWCMASYITLLVYSMHTLTLHCCLRDQHHDHCMTVWTYRTRAHIATVI